MTMQVPPAAARPLYDFLLWLQRCHVGMPGRWRVQRYLDQRKDALRSLHPAVRSLASGVRIYVDPADYDGFNYIRYGFNPAEPVTRFLSRVLRQGDTFIDVGANVGYMSALASQSVGAKGRVLAFEASPATFERLSALKTQHPNVELHHCAVADRDGELEFNLGPAHHTGLASLRELGASSGKVRVKAVALDSWMSRLPKVDLVKIDVEGAEVLVLRGMRALIARDRPVLLVEVTPAFLAGFGHDWRDISAPLKGERYVSLNIADGSVFEGVAEGRRQGDVAWVPEELLGRVRAALTGSVPHLQS